MMKKFLFVTSIVIFFGLAPHVFAQGFVPLAKIPGLTDVQPTTGGLASFFNNLYKYLIGLAAVFAVIEIIWGGLEISTKDSVSKQTDGKERIQQALFGLVLVLSPVLVFSVINPNILNLSLNLPKLDTATATSTPGSGPGTGPGGTQLPPAPATGCTLARSGPYLETAVCATANDVGAYPCTNGLTLQAYACKRIEAGSNKCLDTSITAYCAGKSIKVTYQKAYRFYGIIPQWDSTVVPRDAATQSAFDAACRTDGGVMDSTITPEGALFVATYTGPAGIVISNGCTDTGVTYDTRTQSDVVCYSQKLSCNPP